LKCSVRRKDGKEHRSWSIVESRRVKGGRSTVQKHVLYLGEINDDQRAGWQKTIEVVTRAGASPVLRQMALFAGDRAPQEVPGVETVQVRLSQMSLRRPRQWGACWLFTELWRDLQLDTFWQERLAPSRKGTPWAKVLATLVAHRLIDPGSEWALHRSWFERSAMADLLGDDFRLAADDTLYRCHDLLLEHKSALFDHLQDRWRDLFGAKFEVLLYDLTSTYFESDPPENTDDKRRFGYSRDKRGDCVQVVIALVVTPDGFPLAYEALPGNTSDKTTLRAFLQKIETQYGKAGRIWVMDRGIPTEEVLAEMRASDPPVSYLVGTPKARLGQLEKELAQKPWEEVRTGVDVKLLPQENELYVLAQSRDRVHKERSMRKRQLKKLWARLKELRAMKSLKRDALLMKLGAAKNESPSAWKLVEIKLPEPRQSVTPETFTFRLLREKLREARRREGRYLLRSNLTSHDPAALWKFYLQLTQIEEAFKNLKGDLALRPIYHQREDRIEAHIFVAFLAYCLQVTLRQRLRVKAPGLTPRVVLEKFAAVQMLDVHLPTTDGRHLVLTRYTQPEPEIELLLAQLDLHLPSQSPPKVELLSPEPPRPV
jgi:transposase